MVRGILNTPHIVVIRSARSESKSLILPNAAFPDRLYIIPEVSIDNQIIEEIVKPLKQSTTDEEIKAAISLATQDLQNASISELKHMADVFQGLVPSQKYIDQYESMLRRKEREKLR